MTMNPLCRVVAIQAFVSASALAQFTCPDDGRVDGVASNVSGTTDKVLTITGTGADKSFKLIVERRSVVNEVVMWEQIEVVSFTENNMPPVTIPPGCRASVEDTDTTEDDETAVTGTANLT
jgi:hypothetical protein